MSQDRINKYARIFFNSVFLAFAVFGLYLSFCDAYKYKGDSGKILFTSLLFSFVICVLWMNNNLWYGLGRLAVNLIVVIIIIKNYARIENEFEILYGYIKKQYYIYQGLGEIPVDRIRTNIVMFGISVYEKLAMVLVIFIIITIMALASVRLKWYFMLMLPVVSVIGMEMFHGKAPSVPASFFLVTGISGLLFNIKLESCGGRKNFWQDRHIPGQIPERYVLFISIMAVSFIVSLAAGKATNKKIFVNSKKVLEKQHKLERDVQELAGTVKRYIINGQDGYLDNKSPDQKGRSVLRIETDKMPENNIYIKSFSMDIYENGRWKSFSNVNPPVPETDIGMETYNSVKTCISAKKNVAASLDWTVDIDNFNMDIIPDWKLAGMGSFMPYMYSEGEDGYQFNCYNMQNWMMGYMLSMSEDEMKFYGIHDMEEYTGFVYNKYLMVPPGLLKLRSFVDDELFTKEFFLGDNIGNICMRVKNAICRDTKYSQNLKDVPPGQDYIEYFLFGQKKGYCEHYATAGTVLLRLAGVPARYVSGYFVRPSEFRFEHDKSGNGKYVAYVKDYNAHAWTEVYKTGFGWLPFDMTNTVLDDEYEESGSSVDMQDDFSQEMAGSEESNPSTDEDDSSSPDEEIGQEEDLQESEETANNNTGENENSISTVKNVSMLSRKVIFIIAILLIAITPLIFIRIKFLFLYKRTRNAGTASKRIISCFDLLNKYLAFCGLRGVSKLEDTRYIEKISFLIAGENPERALNILQCAAFSNKDMDMDDEKEALLFVKNVSGSAYKRCHMPVRFIIYILTGRKEINIFTKVYN